MYGLHGVGREGLYLFICSFGFYERKKGEERGQRWGDGKRWLYNTFEIRGNHSSSPKLGIEEKSPIR